MPVVGSGIWNGMALGWWDGGAWVQAEEGSVLPASGGEDYQVALIGSEEIIQGGAPDDVGCEVLSYFFPSIAFENGDALETVIDDGSGGERSISGVAVSAAWDITPRPFVFAEPRPEMETAALELLTARGFDRTSAPIVQVVEGDLESDGSIESIVVAEDTELANSISDVYSLAFILSESDPTPVVVAESAFPPGTEGYPATLRVSAVADLNGDDSLEVVVDLDEWESDGIAVFEPTVGGYEARIGTGCGA
jgi:hypothetical protein